MAAELGDGPFDVSTGKLNGVPSTTPLSVTGPAAGGPAPDRRRPLALVAIVALVLAPGWRSLAAGQGTAAAGETRSPSTASPVPPAPITAAPITGARRSDRAAPLTATSDAGAPPHPGPVSPTATGAPGAISRERFAQLLGSGDLDALEPACRQLAAAGDGLRLRQLRQRLLRLHPAPQPLAVVLANAEVLLSCRMPEAAGLVLERISPTRAADQQLWLTLRWRAAHAALDHSRAAQALEQLAAGQPARLESLELPVRQRQDGSWWRRPALELLADHLEASGQQGRAASLLLLSSRADAAAAERLLRGLRLLSDLPTPERDALFERALEQAAAAGSWGLVGELLRTQATLPAGPAALARNRERRLRLSQRLDDAYGQWQTLAEDPGAIERRRELERRLRSPQDPGGHATSAADAGGGARHAPPGRSGSPTIQPGPGPSPLPSQP